MRLGRWLELRHHLGTAVVEGLSAMPVGFAALSLQYIADILCLLLGHEPPFGIRRHQLETA